MPSDIPSDVPSDAPSDVPSDQPSSVPSSMPSDIPSDVPSDAPSDVPSDQPSSVPSSMPSDIPSDVPSDAPSDVPSDQPSSLPSDQPSVAPVSFPEQCNPLTNPPTQPPCFVIPDTNCPGKPPGTCGSTDPCDACPSDALCQEGTVDDDVGEGNFYCIACGCGFYDSSGTACCKTNGSTANPNCIANGPSDSDQCSPDHFGGIPSIDGSGNSDICNGSEKLSGSGNSCLMASVNDGCVCIPSTTELCKDPSLADVVCRAFEMVDDNTEKPCDACRQCMIDECELEASQQSPSLSGDWTTEAAVVETLGNWNDLTCRTAVELNCANVCAYDPSSLPSSMPSDIPSDVPSDQPSSLPSSMPSDVPSDQPSSLPSSMPSDIPSDVPSDQPSVQLKRTVKRGRN